MHTRGSLGDHESDARSDVSGVTRMTSHINLCMCTLYIMYTRIIHYYFFIFLCIQHTVTIQNMHTCFYKFMSCSIVVVRTCFLKVHHMQDMSRHINILKLQMNRIKLF